jgi:hypothetical protein
MTEMSFETTLIDAEGNVLQDRSDGVPPGCIGGVLEVDGAFFAFLIAEDGIWGEAGLGLYETFELAVEALRGNHRREWTHEERLRAAYGW